MAKERETPGLFTPPSAKSVPNGRDKTKLLPVTGTEPVGNFGESQSGDNQYTVRKVPASATRTTTAR